jgi:hypothetical protein
MDFWLLPHGGIMAGVIEQNLAIFFPLFCGGLADSDDSGSARPGPGVIGGEARRYTAGPVGVADDLRGAVFHITSISGCAECNSPADPNGNSVPSGRIWRGI